VDIHRLLALFAIRIVNFFDCSSDCLQVCLIFLSCSRVVFHLVSIGQMQNSFVHLDRGVYLLRLVIEVHVADIVQQTRVGFAALGADPRVILLELELLFDLLVGRLVLVAIGTLESLVSELLLLKLDHTLKTLFVVSVEVLNHVFGVLRLVEILLTL